MQHFSTVRCDCEGDLKCHLHAGLKNATTNAATSTSSNRVDFVTKTDKQRDKQTKQNVHVVMNPLHSSAVTNVGGGGGGIGTGGGTRLVSGGGHTQGASDPSQSLSFPPYHPIYSKAASYHYGKSHHSKEFTDVRQMESTLYKLLSEFNHGNLHAFGEGVTFENMIKVREQQENLARLHFELNLQQSHKHSLEHDFFNDPTGHSATVNTVMSKPFSKSNMLKLIQNLQSLCKSIERLQWKNSNELEFN